MAARRWLLVKAVTPVESHSESTSLPCTSSYCMKWSWLQSRLMATSPVSGVHIEHGRSSPLSSAYCARNNPLVSHLPSNYLPIEGH